MKTQEELNEILVDIDYWDDESIIRGFLTLSALNRMNEFDFENAFEYLKNPIKNKLIEHGQCEYEDFEDNASYIYCYSDSDYEVFTRRTDYINISIEDVKEAILKMQYKKLNETFDGCFTHLEDLIERIKDLPKNEKDLVVLFDEVIHAQHTTGYIFEDLDIENIKQDLDEKLLELMGIYH
jgi:cellobiose phosphorylase